MGYSLSIPVDQVAIVAQDEAKTVNISLITKQCPKSGLFRVAAVLGDVRTDFAAIFSETCDALAHVHRTRVKVVMDMLTHLAEKNYPTKDKFIWVNLPRSSQNTSSKTDRLADSLRKAIAERDTLQGLKLRVGTMMSTIPETDAFIVAHMSFIDAETATWNTSHQKTSSDTAAPREPEAAGEILAESAASDGVYPFEPGHRPADVISVVAFGGMSSGPASAPNEARAVSTASSLPSQDYATRFIAGLIAGAVVVVSLAAIVGP